MASRHLSITQVAVAGTSFSPVPCQAWHSYMVTSAHRVEVNVIPTELRAHPKARNHPDFLDVDGCDGGAFRC
jgi:hypothetical protein